MGTICPDVAVSVSPEDLGLRIQPDDAPALFHEPAEIGRAQQGMKNFTLEIIQ